MNGRLLILFFAAAVAGATVASVITYSTERHHQYDAARDEIKIAAVRLDGATVQGTDINQYSQLMLDFRTSVEMRRPLLDPQQFASVQKAVKIAEDALVIWHVIDNRKDFDDSLWPAMRDTGAAKNYKDFKDWEIADGGSAAIDEIAIANYKPARRQADVREKILSSALNGAHLSLRHAISGLGD